VAAVLVVFSVAPAVRSASRAEQGGGSPRANGQTAIWDGLLHRYGHRGGVDYRGLESERAKLSAFIEDLGTVDPSALDRRDRLAFWINAYNSVVVDFVLERYPGIQSVRKVDGFFDRFKARVAGRQMTLDQIEARARSFGDPRVHFALVCASASCPDLRPEAYRGSDLEAQIEDQVKTFLANPEKGMRFDRSANTLYLSSIFKWYAGDFTGGSTIVAYFLRGGVLDWVLQHLPSNQAAVIRAADPSITYLNYDWSLNDRPR